MISKGLLKIFQTKNICSRTFQLMSSSRCNFSSTKIESNVENKGVKGERTIIRDLNMNNSFIRNIKEQQSECWNCNSRSFQSNLFICGSCQHLQDPSDSITTMNYFKLFEMGLQYNINQQELTQRYKDLQKSFHPDKFCGLRNPKITKFSETYSTYINEAYSTLKDDLKRGEYLVDMLTHGKKEDLEKKVDQNPQFLNEIMIERMEIEECETDEELNTILEKLQQTKQQISLKIDEFLQVQDYYKATESIIRMRYNQSSINAIKSKQEQIIFQK